jgi:hypothetical protein
LKVQELTQLYRGCKEGDPQNQSEEGYKRSPIQSKEKTGIKTANFNPEIDARMSLRKIGIRLYYSYKIA